MRYVKLIITFITETKTQKLLINSINYMRTAQKLRLSFFYCTTLSGNVYLY